MQLSKKAASVGFLGLGSIEGNRIRITASNARIDVAVRDARRVFETGLADKCRD
jgi:hypothetical protein